MCSRQLINYSSVAAGTTKSCSVRSSRCTRQELNHYYSSNGLVRQIILFKTTAVHHDLSSEAAGITVVNTMNTITAEHYNSTLDLL